MAVVSPANLKFIHLHSFDSFRGLTLTVGQASERLGILETSQKICGLLQQVEKDVDVEAQRLARDA